MQMVYSLDLKTLIDLGVDLAGSLIRLILFRLTHSPEYLQDFPHVHVFKTS